MIGIRVLPRHHSKLQGFQNEQPFFFRLYFFRDCLILVPALMAVDEVSSAGGGFTASIFEVNCNFRWG